MITVLFKSILSEYVPGEPDQVELTYEPDLTIRAILEQYGLQPGHIGLAMVDGQVSDLDCPLHDGVTVELYPIFGGG